MAMIWLVYFQLHTEMHETLWEMHRTQDQFIEQVDLLTQKIIELQNTLISQQRIHVPSIGTVDTANTSEEASASMLRSVTLPMPTSRTSLPTRTEIFIDHPPSGKLQRVDDNDCIRL